MKPLTSSVIHHGEARSLVELPNISFLLAEKLTAIGITHPEQLRRIGAVAVWTRLRNSACGPLDERTIYALEGAIQGVPWQSLAPSIRRRLEVYAAPPADTRPPDCE